MTVHKRYGQNVYHAIDGVMGAVLADADMDPQINQEGQVLIIEGSKK